MLSYQGTVNKIIYSKPASDFKIILLTQKDKTSIKMMGFFPDIEMGQYLSVEGTLEKEKNSTGQILKVSKFEKPIPTNADDALLFLKSGLIKGIGPKLAGDMIDKFGMDIFDIMSNSPERLLEIPKIGTVKKQQIIESWNKYRHLHELIVFLNGFNISIKKAREIDKYYGLDALKIIKDNPYILAKTIKGISFNSIDKMALKLGYDKKSPNRLKSGILYCLDEFSDQGHTCVPLVELVDKAIVILDLPKADLKDVIIGLRNEQEIMFQATSMSHNPYVYLRRLYEAEVEVEERIKAISKAEYKLQKPDKQFLDDIAQMEAEENVTLSNEQKMAVLKATSQKLFILTGGPGTGKTTVCNFIVQYFKKLNKKLALVSPTGKAAQRLAEVTKYETSTIHKLLGYDFQEKSFRYNENFPLHIDAILIDEFSMVDLSLFRHVLKALPENVQIILVGDTDQLPSIQPGNLLHDFIHSELFSVVTLKKIFRQAEKSLIIRNAHAINRGQELTFPSFSQHQVDSGSDFFFIEKENPESINNTIIKLLTVVLPRLGYSADDVQILSPMKKYENGVHILNKIIQNELNPSDANKAELAIMGNLFRETDRLIQTRNNYMHEVFNGQCGTLVKVESEDQKLIVDFDGKEITYNTSEIDELKLAYALTIHKSQGSQYPVVIIPLSQQHSPMLHRNIIYTAITRAKKLVFIVGEKRSLQKAIKTEDNKKRYSCLLTRLKYKQENVVKTAPITKTSYQEFLRKKRN